MSTSLMERAVILLARLRLLLAIAGMAWLCGYSPDLGGRVAAGFVVLLVLALDYVAGATATERAPVVAGRRPGGAR